MNLITAKQLFAILISILGSVFAFMNFVRKKNDKGEFEIKAFQKAILILVLVIIVAYVFLSSYLEIVNRDQIKADLHITVADPRIVNVKGSETDRFVIDADYLVVAYNTRFVIDATVIMENLATKELYTYHPQTNEGVFTFTDFKSGQYEVAILTGNKEIYRNIIVLNRSNVLNYNGKDVWDFTAFVFDDFESNAVEFTVALSDANYIREYPVFTIHDGNSNTCYIFSSEIDQNQNNKMAGKFYGYPGHYVLNNAVTTSEMEPIEFDVGT